MDDAKGLRTVDEGAVSVIDSWPEIVFSRDPRRGTTLIAPRGRSPVLFGVRATSRHAAERACALLVDSEATEAVREWSVFQTNQASGDHLGKDWHLTVTDLVVEPHRKHARISTDGPLVLSYAEGGPVNALARWLKPGDEILVAGLLDPDGMVHAERLKLVSSVPRKRLRPLCSECHVRMKSMGAGQGVRCPKCKRREADEWVDIQGTPPFTAWVEPPIDARRHLARPLRWEDAEQKRQRVPNHEEQGAV